MRTDDSEQGKRDMIREIPAKTIVSRVSGIDTYFGLDYGMNLYRGCQHHCIYCDSRSLCYGIDDFDGEVLIKTRVTLISTGTELTAYMGEFPPDSSWSRYHAPNNVANLVSGSLHLRDRG